MKLYSKLYFSLFLLLFLLVSSSGRIPYYVQEGIHADLTDDYVILDDYGDEYSWFAFQFKINVWNNQEESIDVHSNTCHPMELEVSDNISKYDHLISSDIGKLLGFCAKDIAPMPLNLSPGSNFTTFGVTGIGLPAFVSQLPGGNYTFSLATISSHPIAVSYDATLVVDYTAVQNMTLIEVDTPPEFAKIPHTMTTSNNYTVSISFVFLAYSVLWIIIKSNRKD